MLGLGYITTGKVVDLFLFYKEEQQQRYMAEGDWVAISLDGKIFHTLRATLVSEEGSLLHTLFADPASPSSQMVTRDHTHPLRPYLFDRNPKYFAVLLDYLRNQELVIPPHLPRRAILLEAKYFGLSSIVSKLADAEPQFEAQGSMFNRMDVIKILANTKSGERVRLQGVTLDHTDLSRLDLSGVNLSHSSLNHVSFAESNLTGADLSDCHMCDVTMTGALLDGADLSRSTLSNADLTGVSCCRANLSDAVLKNCKLRNSRLNESILVRTDLSQSDMKGCQLHKAKVWQVNLEGVDRQGTSLTLGGVLGERSSD